MLKHLETIQHCKLIDLTFVQCAAELLILCINLKNRNFKKLFLWICIYWSLLLICLAEICEIWRHGQACDQKRHFWHKLVFVFAQKLVEISSHHICMQINIEVVPYFLWRGCVCGKKSREWKTMAHYSALSCSNPPYFTE